MAQQNPYAKYLNPQADPVIKPADPYKAMGENRAERTAEVSIDNTQQDNRRANTKERIGNPQDLRKEFDTLPETKSYKVAVQQLAQALNTGEGPQADLALTYAFAKAMDPDSVVREAEQGMVANSQPWLQAAAENIKKQFGMDGAGNYTPEARAAIRQQIIRAVDSREKLYAGKRQLFTELANRNGIDPLEVVGDHTGESFRQQFRQYDEKRRSEGANVGGITDKKLIATAPDGTKIEFMVPDTASEDEIRAAAAKAVQAKGLNPGSVKVDEAATKRQYEPGAEDMAARLNESGGAPGYGDIIKQGLTLGLSDEAAGIGTAIGALFTGNDVASGYRMGRDAERIRLDQARQATGRAGTATEFVSGMAGGGIAKAPMTIRNALVGGAAMGGTAGFGYGEGAPQSVGNALIGATIGGALGAGGQKLANRTAARPRAASSLIPNANEVVAAGAQEGVTVNRAMIDPRLQNRVTGVDASMAGGPRFQRGMNAIEGQIEGRVNALGQGGTPMNTTVAGQTYRKAGERFIKDSGKAVKVKYDRAEKLAGDAKVTPQQSVALLDEQIARLSETPGTNNAEIAFLKTLKGDLSKDLSVGALRRMRTTLRKKISKGDLVFGEDESRVLGVMDAAADDIRTGLAQQGKGAAAKAFDKADKAYRDRMGYINGTLQKIIGKRGSNLSADQVAANLSGMARGKDTVGVRKFMATLDPEEQADVAATFAEAIGKNNKDQFSVAHFLAQTTEKRFPKEALRAVFGDQAAASIARLRAISEEVNRVTSAMNSRKSGTAVGNDYRSVLFSAFLGMLPGAGTGSVTTALAGATVPTVAKAGRDVLSARMLLNPNVTKWLSTAPKTTNPAAINAHIARLGVIGGVSRMDNQAIQEYLRNVATHLTTAAAANQDEQNTRR